MISGLKAKDYPGKLKELGNVSLKERRHQLDMLQTYKGNKILSGKDKVEVDPGTWFTMASDGERVTRMASDPMNIRQQACRLDIRRNFFSQRVIDNWNKVPTAIKNSVSVNSFKNAFKRHREQLNGPA